MPPCCVWSLCDVLHLVHYITALEPTLYMCLLYSGKERTYVRTYELGMQNPILKEIQGERKKEEQTVYLDGIERIVKMIQLQIGTPNTEVKRDEVSTPSVGIGVGNKSKLLIKPAKVPT